MVMFGGVDKSYYQGALSWVPLIQAGNWHVHMDRLVSPSEGQPKGCSTSVHGHRQTLANGFSDT